jgi:DNA-binding MarR family transcriptional regulator
MGKTVRPSLDKQWPSILHLVKQVQYKAYVQLETVFHPYDITAVQFRILTTLSARPGMSSAQLARLYDVKPQTMIKQILLLESKGLIDRKPSKNNKRLLELKLTPAGKDRLEQCQKDSRELEREILGPLNSREQSELRGYLVRLHTSLSAPLDDEDEGPEIEEFTEEYSRAGVQRP